MQQNIFVITGPTGAGKTTIADYLQTKYAMAKVITHTTRLPRQGEIANQDYYFETPKSFAQNHYLEQVKYAGNQYGSSLEGLNRAWQINDNITIVLDTKGAKTYVEKLGQKVIVLFVTVSNSDILAQRLVNRGDNQQQIKQRLSSHDFERDLTIPADLPNVHVIINDDLTVAQIQLDMVIQNLINNN